MRHTAALNPSCGFMMAVNGVYGCKEINGDAVYVYQADGVNN